MSAVGKSTDSLSVPASTKSRQGQICLLIPACSWVPSYATLLGGVGYGLWPLPKYTQLTLNTHREIKETSEELRLPNG